MAGGSVCSYCGLVNAGCWGEIVIGWTKVWWYDKNWLEDLEACLHCITRLCLRECFPVLNAEFNCAHHISLERFKVLITFYVSHFCKHKLFLCELCFNTKVAGKVGEGGGLFCWRELLGVGCGELHRRTAPAWGVPATSEAVQLWGNQIPFGSCSCGPSWKWIWWLPLTKGVFSC